jgi:hypothetical protein
MVDVNGGCKLMAWIVVVGWLVSLWAVGVELGVGCWCGLLVCNVALHYESSLMHSECLGLQGHTSREVMNLLQKQVVDEIW